MFTVWAPIIISGLSILIAAVGWAMRRPLDKEQLAKLRREQLREDEERDRVRCEADKERDRTRREADERRAERLRHELEELSELSNQRFRQWREAISDLDDLWMYVEDQVLPWQRQAYRELIELNSKIGPPPHPIRRRRRPHHDSGDGDG